MERQEKLKELEARRKNWLQGAAKQQIKNKMRIQEGMQNYAANLIQKMNDPIAKNQKKISKEIQNQIESNVCSICFELMIPPVNQPMILIPCGHNICKTCIYSDGHIPNKIKYTLKLDKCPLCRIKIESHALNRNLMTLICMYTNNKDLLEKENQRQKQVQALGQNHGIQKLKMRCEILQKQKQSIIKELKMFKKQKQILEDVMVTLKSQKKRNQVQRQKLQEEARLINKHLDNKAEELQLMEKKVRQLSDKQRLVQKTLNPLIKQKQKLQILQVARLMQEM